MSPAGTVAVVGIGLAIWGLLTSPKPGKTQEQRDEDWDAEHGNWPLDADGKLFGSAKRPTPKKPRR